MTDSSSNSEEIVRVSCGRVNGRLELPSSKSASHRAFNMALLAGGGAEIWRPLQAEDTELFLAALPTAGISIERFDGGVRLARRRPVEGGRIECGNAGTLLRFMVASLTALPGAWVVDGTSRLRERPVGPLVDALRQLGARIEYLREKGYPPLAIHGASLVGGGASLDAGESSQYLSAILMAGQLAQKPIVLEVEALASAPYVELTVQALEAFEGRFERVGECWKTFPSRLVIPSRLEIEADDSAACYPAAGAALTGGRVELVGLRRDSRQGDRKFLELLAEMGAQVSWTGGLAVIEGGALEAVTADLSSMPDQVPTLAALAPFARGTTHIVNVAHLRIKESDRLRAMATELARVGAEVEEKPDGLVIPGIWADRKPPTDEVTTQSWNDHRIAMSMALVGLRRPGVSVSAPEVVGKSYPGFWRDLTALTR